MTELPVKSLNKLIADPQAPIYRYIQRRAGAVIYLGPERPMREPGTSCTRSEWLPDKTAEWGGRWADPEIVF